MVLSAINNESFALPGGLNTPKYGEFGGLRAFRETQDAVKQVLGELLMSCCKLFLDPVSAMQENENVVYAKFSELSRFIKEGLRQQVLASGEVSRCNQNLSKMIIAFESVLK